jgi:hypothetical protein
MNIFGINLSDSIVPGTSEDNFPTHYDIYGKGGYRSVLDITERDSIPLERRSEGMIVRTNTINKLWMLDGGIENFNWVEISLTGSLVDNNNLVYVTGNQTISGIKSFSTRPTVNGVNVLLSGEASLSFSDYNIGEIIQDPISNLNYINFYSTPRVNGINLARINETFPSIMTFGHSNINPASLGQTYYFSQVYDLAPSIQIAAREFMFPFNSKIIGASITVHLNSLQFGSNETASFSLFNKNTNAASTIITGINYTGTIRSSTVTGLNINLASGVPYIIRWTSPQFSTPPSAVRQYLNLFFEKI